MARKRTIKAGSRVLLVYRAGDCDTVRVVSIPDDATALVRLPDRRVVRVPVEDIGIGVDHELVGVRDDGGVIPA